MCHRAPERISDATISGFVKSIEVSLAAADWKVTADIYVFERNCLPAKPKSRLGARSFDELPLLTSGPNYPKHIRSPISAPASTTQFVRRANRPHGTIKCGTHTGAGVTWVALRFIRLQRVLRIKESIPLVSELGVCILRPIGPERFGRSGDELSEPPLDVPFVAGQGTACARSRLAGIESVSGAKP
jgi:hypothetical protein